QLFDACEDRPRCRRAPEGHRLGETGPDELPRHPRISEDRLDFRGDQEAALAAPVVQRPYTQPVPAENEAPWASVPERRRPLAVTAFETALSPVLRRM